MRESIYREPQRDVEPSSLGRVLELFFGGNNDVDTAVLFDALGETIDYHSYIDPFQTRLAAAHCGILFELASFKMDWLEKAHLEMIIIGSDTMDLVACRVCEEYFLLVMAEKEAANGDLQDAMTACVEVLRKEIGC